MSIDTKQNAKTIALKPRMSEKTYSIYQAENTYVFTVPSTANKMTVALAVESQFDVSVENVRMLVEKGKAKSSYQKNSNPVKGKRSNRKKAFVKVKKGQSIPIFASVEEAEKKAQKAEKKSKKNDKGDE